MHLLVGIDQEVRVGYTLVETETVSPDILDWNQLFYYNTDFVGFWLKAQLQLTARLPVMWINKPYYEVYTYDEVRQSYIHYMGKLDEVGVKILQETPSLELLD